MTTKTVQNIIPVDFGAFKPVEFHSQWVGTEEQGIGSCYLVVTRVPPGTGTPAVHTHTGDQFYFIFKGEMNLHLGDQHHKAKANDLIYIPVAVPHRNWNSTDEEEIHWEFIVPNAPPGLARAYRAQWPEVELKPTVDPHYIRSLDESKFNPNETTHVTLADNSTGSHFCRIDIVQVPVGKDGGALHVAGYDQVYFTMTGSMQFQIGRQNHQVGPNTYVYVPAGVAHTFLNNGSETARTIYVQVPDGTPRGADVVVDLDA
jgi:mannose-6-phosphate isomerase-like protein (cupin superfamily)